MHFHVFIKPHDGIVQIDGQTWNSETPYLICGLYIFMLRLEDVVHAC